MPGKSLPGKKNTYVVSIMVSIAIIGGEGSGRSSLAVKLGKKGNETDITMYDFAKGEQILTIIDPSGYPASPKPLMTALAMADMVLLCIPPKGMDAAAGECVIAIDLMGIKQGIVVHVKRHNCPGLGCHGCFHQHF